MKNKRFVSIVALLCMILTCFAGSYQAVSAKESAGPTQYAAFGDSIAAGYGLEGYAPGQDTVPPDSYQALVAGFLNTQPCNYAVSGDDSDACIALLKSGQADADLKDAGTITLSIGSNDLLLPFIQIIMDYFHIEPGTIDASAFAQGFPSQKLDISDFSKYFQQQEALMAILADNPTLHAKATAFPSQLQEILSILKEKAPHAEIYVTNIYNPFSSVPVFGPMADSYIQEINTAFSADAQDYTLVDVYTPFREENLTNVHFDLSSPANINPDPHPSVNGHKTIGKLVIQALKNNHAPKAATLRSAVSKKNPKLTVKVKLPNNADGCQIQYAKDKNGTYKTLASTSKTAFKTNSSKLKSGKTYYIRAQSFKEINGATYYGNASNTLKVKIK